MTAASHPGASTGITQNPDMPQPAEPHSPLMVLITGPMAAGKSTVAQQLAERIDMSVHLRGDAFRRMVVSGRAEMTETPSAEAMRQLLLRYRAARDAASLYFEAGFSVIYQDTIVGPVLDDVLIMFEHLPLRLIVLCPDQETIARRERSRSKAGYSNVSIPSLYAAFMDTPRVGLWIDNSDQRVAETVDQILGNLELALVR